MADARSGTESSFSIRRAIIRSTLASDITSGITNARRIVSDQSFSSPGVMLAGYGLSAVVRGTSQTGQTTMAGDGRSPR